MFTFKQFHIDDTHCAMKVGTDGVLLGAWAHVADARRILDLGCGSGLIALMAAQRAPAAKVVGVELDAAAAGDARANVLRSPFAERVEIVCADALKYAPAAPFDCILTNPPYHEEELLPPDAARAAARHTDGLSFAALVHTAKRLLRPGGQFVLILPTAAVERFDALALFHGFALVRRTAVVTKVGKPSKRTLLAYVLGAYAAPPLVDTLALMDAHSQRAEEYAALCKDFYL